MQAITRIILIPLVVFLAILSLIGRRFVNDPMLFVLGGGLIFLVVYLLG